MQPRQWYDEVALKLLARFQCHVREDVLRNAVLKLQTGLKMTIAQGRRIGENATNVDFVYVSADGEILTFIHENGKITYDFARDEFVS